MTEEEEDEVARMIQTLETSRGESEGCIVVAASDLLLKNQANNHFRLLSL